MMVVYAALDKLAFVPQMRYEGRPKSVGWQSSQPAHRGTDSIRGRHASCLEMPL
jgi:hypothetical protein